MYQVVKRDGMTVDFDISKIGTAMVINSPFLSQYITSDLACHASPVVCLPCRAVFNYYAATCKNRCTQGEL